MTEGADVGAFCHFTGVPFLVLIAPYVLFLNCIYHRHEELTAICQAPAEEELNAFLESEKVPAYVEGQWYKTFRKGGPLEDYNQPDSRRHILLPSLEITIGAATYALKSVNHPTVADLLRQYPHNRLSKLPLDGL